MKLIAKKDFLDFKKGKKYKINNHHLYIDCYSTKLGFDFLKENLYVYFEPKHKKDKIVTQVLNKFKERSKIGIEKYGTTLHENNTDDFLNHLQEELMDAILYLQKLKNNENKKDS